MPEVVLAFALGEGIEQCSEAMPESIHRSFTEFSEQCFEFGKDLLDWIEIGTVGRQVHQARAHRFDRRANAFQFVAAQIVHDHDVVGFQRGHQMLSHVRQKNFAVNCAVNNQRRGDPRRTQRGQKGRRLPMPVRNIIDQALATRRTTMRTRHIRLGPRLVDKDKVVRIPSALPDEPRGAKFGHIRPLLFGGVEHFF